MPPLKSILPVIFLYATTIVAAQSPDKNLELGPFIGATNYLGDLVDGPINYLDTRPGIGLVAKVNYTQRIALRGGISYGHIAAKDERSMNRYRNKRNLSFRSHVLDFSMMLEFSLLRFEPQRRGHRFTPYGFAGISIFHFNPKAKYQYTWYALQPLGTEGQGVPGVMQINPYPLWQMSVPMGVGFKKNLNYNWNLAIETRFHKTFTDYLDDVSNEYADNDLIRAHYGDIAAALADRSPEVNEKISVAGTKRGQPLFNDWYIFTGITITYLFNKEECFKF